MIFSPDSTRIVYRAAHPSDPAEVAKYKDLLAQRLVEPGQLEIFVINVDGSHKQQVTSNGASNFSPYFHPDGKRIIFSSNLEVQICKLFSLHNNPAAAPQPFDNLRLDAATTVGVPSQVIYYVRASAPHNGCIHYG